MAGQGAFETPVTRYYIDVRPYTPAGAASRSQTVVLPHIETLPADIQTSVNRYLRAPDKYMSLASALLKFLFIHRTAKIPWSQIRISRTPKPHSRPYWDPPLTWHGEGFEGIEFNVSHQAGIVVLLGCHTPHRPIATTNEDDFYGYEEEEEQAYVEPDPDADKQPVKVGIDVACAKEPGRTQDLSTQAKLDEWVDTFAEMFSQRERNDMKNLDVATGSTSAITAEQRQWDASQSQLDLKARRFYTQWALKEAYIKLVGEGLLADWLRRLEYVNVVPPRPHERVNAEEAGLQVLFKGKDITKTLTTELIGLEDIFLLATMLKGVKEVDGPHGRDWVKLDIEKDIRPCATGTCTCLNLGQDDS